MPRNFFQRAVFAAITVLITVHAYVFFSLYVVNGEAIKSAAGASGVLEAISKQGGVYMCGAMVPIWAVVVVEFILAITLELTIGSPCSFKLAVKVFDPRTTNPVLFETAIISATVAIMCPMMSFIAAFLYYPYYEGFSILTLLADWLKLMCYNFPFAYFTQLFFIQPFVRTAFKFLFRKDLKMREQEQMEEAVTA